MWRSARWVELGAVFPMVSLLCSLVRLGWSPPPPLWPRTHPPFPAPAPALDPALDPDAQLRARQIGGKRNPRAEGGGGGLFGQPPRGSPRLGLPV